MFLLTARDWFAILDRMSKRGRPSLATQRHESIVTQVRHAGAVRVTELAEQLDVSEMTVRRDLDALHEAGLVVKVHGGATVRYEHSSDEPGFEVKALRNTIEKRAIAASAALLAGPGAAIGITAGTTNAALATELVTVPELTVVTNSVRVAEVFHQSDRPDRTVVLVGGERTPSDALVGPVAVAAIRMFHLDMVFLGVHGFDERAGFTTPNLREAETNRAFVDTAEQLVVLADHSKWGIVGLATIAPLARATVCVTDDGLSDEIRAVVERHIDRVVVPHPDFVQNHRST